MKKTEQRRRIKNARIGADFDDFLAEEGILKACQTEALTRIGQCATRQANALDILRNRAKLRLMSGQLQFLTDNKGRKTAVVMPIEEYNKLLEDLGDLAMVSKRRIETSFPQEELKRSLKRGGIFR